MKLKRAIKYFIYLLGTLILIPILLYAFIYIQICYFPEDILGSTEIPLEQVLLMNPDQPQQIDFTTSPKNATRDFAISVITLMPNTDDRKYYLGYSREKRDLLTQWTQSGEKTDFFFEVSLTFEEAGQKPQAVPLSGLENGYVGGGIIQTIQSSTPLPLQTNRLNLPCNDILVVRLA